MDSWDQSEKWYNECVGEKGHYYHQKIVIPNICKIIQPNKGISLLDLGCGQGVLARALSKEIEYWGVDLSPKLIQDAKKLGKQGHFVVADATKPLPLEKKGFDWACLILSLQNMEDAEGAIRNAKEFLKEEGRLLIVLNHPCFRIPRQSHWGIDPKSKIQYRRMDLYMSKQKIPIQTNPSKSDLSAMTYSYHRSLSDYSEILKKEGFVIEKIEEWCSDKVSEGGAARMENRARKEFPLFLMILALSKKMKRD